MKTIAGLVFAASLLLAGCVTPQGLGAPSAAASSTLAGDAAHPASTVGWVRTELYFGLGLEGTNSGVDEAGWRAFLDREVTSRFPDGLSVVDVYGQWQGKGQAQPERLRSKLLLLMYPDTPAHRADVEAIRAAWKAKTGDQSVLRVTQPAEVSF
jgi:predicted small secreted protein